MSIAHYLGSPFNLSLGAGSSIWPTNHLSNFIPYETNTGGTPVTPLLAEGNDATHQLTPIVFSRRHHVSVG